MPDTPEVPVAPVAPVVSKPNPVMVFLSDAWAKIESLDTTLNTWVTKVTAGHTTLAIIVAALAYWLLPVKAILEFILQVPALAVKYILLALSFAVPALINAIPYMAGIVLALLALVEIKNLVTKLIKK